MTHTFTFCTEFQQVARSFLYLASFIGSYNQLQKYLSLFQLFGLKWPVHDLALKTPLSPSSSPLRQVAGNTLLCSLTSFGGTTFKGGEEERKCHTHRCVTSRDFK